MKSTIQRWNTNKGKYEQYSVPIAWNISFYESDMNKMINCAACGKEVEFGSTYTSKEIHTDSGFGYSVCEDCYSEELERAEGGF